MSSLPMATLRRAIWRGGRPGGGTKGFFLAAVIQSRLGLSADGRSVSTRLGLTFPVLTSTRLPERRPQPEHDVPKNPPERGRR